MYTLRQTNDGRSRGASLSKIAHQRRWISAALHARSSAGDGVIKNQDEHRPNYSDEQAIQVYTGDAVRSEHAEHPAPNYGAHDSQHDIQNHPFTALVH